LEEKRLRELGWAGDTGRKKTLIYALTSPLYEDEETLMIGVIETKTHGPLRLCTNLNLTLLKTTANSNKLTENPEEIRTSAAA